MQVGNIPVIIHKFQVYLLHFYGYVWHFFAEPAEAKKWSAFCV